METKKGESISLTTILGTMALWLTPLAFALMGPLYAWPKARMNGNSPGFHIALINDETIRAQGMWRFLADNRWMFILYGLALLVLGLMVKRNRSKYVLRSASFVGAAAPGFWYGWQMMYLGGKLLAI